MAPKALCATRTVSLLCAEPGRRFYHSCQLRDFESYLRSGAVRCRADLRALGDQACTPYETDALNCERGVLRHIFGNLGDNAWAYRFLAGVPDIYGPIHLEFDLRALEEFHFLTVRRNGVSAPEPGVVDDEAELPALYHTALPDRLRGDYKGEIEGHGAELSFVHLRRIVVMPLAHHGVALPALVRGLADEALRASGRGPDFVVRDAASEHLGRLAGWARESSREGWEDEPLPPFVFVWLREIAEHRNLRGTPFDREAFTAKLRRYARSLEHGTLSRMRGEDGFLTFNF